MIYRTVIRVLIGHALREQHKPYCPRCSPSSTMSQPPPTSLTPVLHHPLLGPIKGKIHPSSTLISYSGIPYAGIPRRFARSTLLTHLPSSNPDPNTPFNATRPGPEYIQPLSSTTIDCQGFGGDPARLSAMGQSEGGENLALHALSGVGISNDAGVDGGPGDGGDGGNGGNGNSSHIGAGIEDDIAPPPSPPPPPTARPTQASSAPFQQIICLSSSPHHNALPHTLLTPFKLPFPPAPRT
jgi:hypothetical protein